MVAPDVVIVGLGLMVISIVAVAEHPAAFLPVTVYVVVTVAEQVTGVPVEALSPVVGNQE